MCVCVCVCWLSAYNQQSQEGVSPTHSSSFPSPPPLTAPSLYQHAAQRERERGRERERVGERESAKDVLQVFDKHVLKRITCSGITCSTCPIRVQQHKCTFSLIYIHRHTLIQYTLTHAHTHMHTNTHTFQPMKWLQSCPLTLYPSHPLLLPVCRREEERAGERRRRQERAGERRREEEREGERD